MILRKLPSQRNAHPGIEATAIPPLTTAALYSYGGTDSPSPRPGAPRLTSASAEPPGRGSSPPAFFWLPFNAGASRSLSGVGAAVGKGKKAGRGRSVIGFASGRR